MTNAWYRWDGKDLFLRIDVQPRSRRDAFSDPGPGFLRVRVTAPPANGAANDHLLRWLAKRFGVSRSAVTLVRGPTGRSKRARIQTPKTLPMPDIDGN